MNQSTSKWVKKRLLKDTVTLKWNIEDIRDPSANQSHPFTSPQMEKTFRLIFEVAQNKTRISLQCVNADEWHKEQLIVRYHILLNNDNCTRKFINNRVFVCKLGDNNKYFDYGTFDVCKPYVVDDKLRIICSVKIFEEILNVKLEDLMDLSDSIGSLLTSGTLSDMTLSVVDGKDFPVHKNILATRSPVFAAMFEHKDSREVQENRISIEDMSSDVCEVMLKHIYTGQVSSVNMIEYAFDLYVAADKYQLSRLKSICEEALLNLLDIDTVCSVLLVADGCNATKLKSSCIDFITDNSVDVMKSELETDCG